jgi:hypothetical protein
MPVEKKIVDFHERAKEVRGIAKTLFDTTERETVLQFLDDCENLLVQSGSDFKLQ